MKNRIKLADATARRSPVPPQGDRESLRPGDYTKVILETEESGERMWLLVQSETNGGRYLGTLSNTPILVTGVA